MRTRLPAGKVRSFKVDSDLIFQPNSVLIEAISETKMFAFGGQCHLPFPNTLCLARSIAGYFSIVDDGRMGEGESGECGSDT